MRTEMNGPTLGTIRCRHVSVGGHIQEAGKVRAGSRDHVQDEPGWR